MARMLHRWVCPVLGAEADACRVRREQGVYLNRDLPDFERRFLHDLQVHNTAGSAELYPMTRIDCLTRWRASTVEARRVGSPLLPTLLAVENAVFLHHGPIPPEAESVARAEGWEVDSLLEYVADKDTDLSSLPSITSTTASMRGVPLGEPRWMQLPFAATLLAVVMALLVTGLVLVDAQTAAAVTNRTMIYAMLIAPTGALLRWKLSGLNGNCTFLPEEWQWLPVGTFTANIVGSIVSIVAVAIEYRLDNSNFDVEDFWAIGTIRAVKVGFAGCLTTVSTFVAEISGFMHNKTNHAYPYILTTLCTACFLSCLIFGCIVYLI